MKKASEMLGLKLMGMKEGEVKGSAIDYMIGTDTRKVEYFILKESRSYGFLALPVKDIIGVGANYIMTQTNTNAEKIYDSKELLEAVDRGFYLLGTTVLSSSGNIIGRVEDFTFDERSGELDTLFLDNGSELSAEDIVTLSKDIVFVNQEGDFTADLFKDVNSAEKEAAPAEEQANSEEITFLKGRKLTMPVTSQDGSFVIQSGTVLDETLINEAAKYEGMLMELTLNVE